MKSEIPWIKIPPVREVDIGGVLGDIEAHMPANHIYRDKDKVTWAHETTHGLNSRIRNEHGKSGDNGFYALHSYGIIIKEPPFTITQLARRIPSEWRAPATYNLYLVQSRRYWDNQPLYMLDEWIAYTNGTLTGMDYNLESRTIYSFQLALEFTKYVEVLVSFAQEVASPYCSITPEDYDTSTLQHFYDWHIIRLRYIYESATKDGWLTSKHQKYADLLHMKDNYDHNSVT